MAPERRTEERRGCRRERGGEFQQQAVDATRCVSVPSCPRVRFFLLIGCLPVSLPLFFFLYISGDDFDDLVPSDRGSVTSEDEISDETDDEEDESVSQNASVSSSATSGAPPALNAAAISAGEEEFQTEVRLSLDRAFSEGHSLENASVELKTLRMASNVPLRRVREAVVAGIVEGIPLVEGAVPQRAEIKRWVDRWGDLINLIGGVDGIETVSILQVGSFSLLYVVLDRAHNYCDFSITAHPRRAFTCSVRSLRHFIKTILSKRRTFDIGTLCRKPRAIMSGMAFYWRTCRSHGLLAHV